MISLLLVLLLRILDEPQTAVSSVRKSIAVKVLDAEEEELITAVSDLPLNMRI